MGHYKTLRLFGLDPYDLALSKLERNAQIDRDDVKYLFRTVQLDVDVLEARYRSEQRPYLPKRVEARFNHKVVVGYAQGAGMHDHRQQD